jgi:hypothetical protein
MIETQVTYQDDVYQANVEKPDYPTLGDDYLPRNVHLHIEYGRHENAQDFESTGVLLPNADIYIPEWPVAKPEDLQFMRRVVQSNHTNFLKLVDHTVQHPFRRAELEALRGSFKQVVLVDTLEGELDHAKIIRAVERDVHEIKPDFEDALLQAFSDKAITVFEAGLARDVIVLEKLGPALHAALKANPKLAKKEQIVTLMRYGAAHWPISERLSNSAVANQLSTSSSYSAGAITLRERLFKRLETRLVTDAALPRKLVAAMFAIGNCRLMPCDGSVPDQKTVDMDNAFASLVLRDDIEEVARETHRFMMGTSNEADKNNISVRQEAAHNSPCIDVEAELNSLFSS